MSRWTVITPDDLADAKVAALVTALRSAALGEGQTDPTPRLTQTVVDQVRRKIASHATNRLDANPAAVPAGLKDLVAELVLFALKNRLEIALTEDERDRNRNYLRDLDRIAAGTDVVEQPDDAIPAPVQSTAGTPAITPRVRRFSRADADGC